jgi:hypothetical protein
MKASNYYLIILFSFIFWGCISSGNNIENNGTLKEFFNYFDKIDKEELHYSDLGKEYSRAYGKNDASAIKAVEDKFAATHKRGIELVMQKYPSGAIQFPFEQTGTESYVQIKSVYISGYDYPWNTAYRNSFYLTFEYELKQTNFHYKSVRVEFYDTDGDVINACNVALNKSGKTTIYIRPEAEIRKFLNLKIVSPQI